MTCTSASLAPTATAGAPSACATATWPRRGPSPRRTSSSPSRTTASRWTPSRRCSSRRGWGRRFLEAGRGSRRERRARRAIPTEHHALLLQDGQAEIQKEPPGQPAGTQVVDDLGEVMLGQANGRLEFDQDIAANQVRTVGHTQVFSFVRQGEGHLALVRDPTKPQLNGQCFVVHRLEISWPVPPVDFDCSADDRVGFGVGVLFHAVGPTSPLLSWVGRRLASAFSALSAAPSTGDVDLPL